MKAKYLLIGVLSTLFFQLVIFTIIFLNSWNILSHEKIITTDIAVMEGWICDHSIKKAAEYIKNNNIGRVYISGNSIEKQSDYFPAKDFANLGALILKKELKDYPCEIIPVPVDTKVDRTLKSAEKVIKYIEKNEKDIYGIIILTEEIHSKRTFLSYKKVSKILDIGVLPLEDSVISEEDWMRSSTGVKRVLTEIIALFYKKIRRKI